MSTLSDVPEEFTPKKSSHSPYHHSSRTSSTSTLTSTFKASASASTGSLTAVTPNAGTRLSTGPRSPITARSASPRPASEAGTSGSGSTRQSRRNISPAGTVTGKDKEKEKERGERDKDKDTRSLRAVPSTSAALANRPRNTPHLPHSKDIEPAPATLMYWSRAPVYGTMPDHAMRAHSVTVVDGTAWVFGGCDEKTCSRNVWCFNTETMQWSKPELTNTPPARCRAQSATLVDRRIFFIGGGQGEHYYNKVFVLDTVQRRWLYPTIDSGEDIPTPPPRRAHTAVLYKGNIWVFGGGNGSMALNDVWTLDVSVPVEKIRRWVEVKTEGKRPSPRGYHTANLVGNVMVVVGGSDGIECFSDVWCLNLDTRVWSMLRLEAAYRRLAHTSTQVGSYLFIMGGHEGGRYTSELVLFNLVSLAYETRPLAGRFPHARGYHAAFLADSRLFILGGFNGSEVFDDMHILDLAGAAYLPQVTSFRIDVD